MITWALAAALALPAPAPATVASVADAAMPERAQIMALPPELRARLQEEIIGKGRSDMQRLERLVDFMFDEHGLGMQYRHDATHTVAQAYATRKANCLSFTLLFVAMARKAGLDVYAQEIEETLAWRQEDNTVYRTNHINAGVRVAGRRYTVDVARDSVIARHSPEPVSDQRLMVHYYNNRAAELMAHGETAAARTYMRMSLELDPAYATSWSNAGVVHLRDGDLAAAEHAYARALELDPMHGGALFNMVGLYQISGNRKLEDGFRRRLEAARLKDPFHQFLLALEYEKQGDYPRAIAHYKRAIRLYDG
ncbi:MAG TPA: tetratricopeptide repeat protein, partial [Pseudoxanthomonas sp.]